MTSPSPNHLIIITLVQIGLTLWFRRPRPPPPEPPPEQLSPTLPPRPRVFSRQNSFEDKRATCEAPDRKFSNTSEFEFNAPSLPYEMNTADLALTRTATAPSCGLFSCCSGRNCGCDKTVTFTNRITDKYIDIWIRPSSKFYLAGFGFKDISGQIERTGPDEIIQNVRLPPGDTLQIPVETFSYFISASIDDQQLWFNRRFFTNSDIVFYERQLKRLKPMCKSFKELIE